MPIYEYRCEHCGDFEQMQRITAAPLARCPRCKRKVRRLISQTSFQLKGSGWYVTDYARAGNGAKQKEGEGEGAKAAEGKADAKAPEEKGSAPAKKAADGKAGAAAKKADGKTSTGRAGAPSTSS